MRTLLTTNHIENWLVNENMRFEIENVNAGSIAAISVHNAAREANVLDGHKLGQPLPEDAVREARGREIGMMADHGVYDIVARGAARGAARGKLGEDQVARRLGKELNEFSLGRSAVSSWAKRDGDDTEHATSGCCTSSCQQSVVVWTSVQRHDVLAGWDCSVSFCPCTASVRTVLLSFRRKSCAPLDSCGNFDGP